MVPFGMAFRECIATSAGVLIPKSVMPYAALHSKCEGQALQTLDNFIHRHSKRGLPGREERMFNLWV